MAVDIIAATEFRLAIIGLYYPMAKQTTNSPPILDEKSQALKGFAPLRNN